jgi:hypothetical protein
LNLVRGRVEDVDFVEKNFSVWEFEGKFCGSGVIAVICHILKLGGREGGSVVKNLTWIACLNVLLLLKIHIRPSVHGLVCRSMVSHCTRQTLRAPLSPSSQVRLKKVSRTRLRGGPEVAKEPFILLLAESEAGVEHERFSKVPSSGLTHNVLVPRGRLTTSVPGSVFPAHHLPATPFSQHQQPAAKGPPLPFPHLYYNFPPSFTPMLAHQMMLQSGHAGFMNFSQSRRPSFSGPPDELHSGRPPLRLVELPNSPPRHSVIRRMERTSAPSTRPVSPSPALSVDRGSSRDERSTTGSLDGSNSGDRDVGSLPPKKKKKTVWKPYEV